MMSAKQFGLPDDFDDLPSFRFSKAFASSRDQSARTDTVFGVKSFADLTQEMQRRLRDIAHRGQSHK